MLNNRTNSFYQSIVTFVVLLSTISVLSTVLVFASGSSGYFGAPQDTFLKLEDAFKSSVTLGEQSVLVSWQIAPSYYLYKKQFRFQVQDTQGRDIPMVGKPQYSPAGIERYDEFMGKTMTFSEVVDVTLPVRLGKDVESVKVIVEFQGCAEAGLCYPPSRREHVSQ